MPPPRNGEWEWEKKAINGPRPPRRGRPSSPLSDAKLRSSEHQKKLKSPGVGGTFAPRTLTSFGFALTH